MFEKEPLRLLMLQKSGEKEKYAIESGSTKTKTLPFATWFETTLDVLRFFRDVHKLYTKNLLSG